VAILFLDIKPIGRSAGRRATAAAAYRAGESIRDERTGRLFNHSGRKDVLHSEILLPSRFSGAEANWARDRATLWNTAERAESRRDARVAREYQVALPHELSPAGRRELARNFARELAERHEVAVDLAIHEPRAGGDSRNFHAHLLTTTREITPTGLGRKTGLDMSGRERQKLGLSSGIKELVAIRERWAALTNEALQAAHIEARVDHRTLEAQGIDRSPRARLPWAAYLAEKRGLRSEIAERVREKYRIKLQARRQRTAQRASSALTVSQGNEPQRSPQFAVTSIDMEDVRRQARERWLEFRSNQAKEKAGAVTLEHGRDQRANPGPEAAVDSGHTRKGHGNDHAL